MKNILFKFIVILLSFPFIALAKDYPTETKPKTYYQENNIALDNLQLTNEQMTPFQNTTEELEITEETLLANPQLLQRTMESTLMRRSIAQIKAVLPIYKKSEYADPILIHYANALINHSEGRYKKAVDSYREILVQEPDLFPIRYSLATALYQSKQFDAALQQFEKLRAAPLPKKMATSVNQAITAIKRQEDWQFSLNFFIKREKNINDAPKQRIMQLGKGAYFKFDKPEKANGIHLDLGASKRFNLQNAWYSKLRLNLNSDYFWDNKKYNDLHLRAGLALGYQNSQLTAEIEPFARKRFFSNRAYSTTLGAKSWINYRFNPKFSLSNTTSIAYEKFDTRHHLNGGRQFTSMMGVYTPSAKQSWFAGASYYRHKARDLDDHFNSKGIFLGWGQVWPKGLSSKILLSANEKTYKGADIFRIKRQDKTYNAELTLWHRGIHFYHLTPKLVLSWEKTNSNHFYYDDRKDVQLNVVFSRDF